jgi:glucose-1-phosphate adenylyltransferase
MIGFQEKPSVEAAKTMPNDKSKILASMGNYAFTTDALVREIVRDAARESAHDFGKSIIAEMYKHSRVFVYDFAQNSVPGQGPKERGYWRDVGLIDTYFQSNMDLIEVDPIFNLYNARWPIYTFQYNYPPAKFVFADREHDRVGTATDSLVSEGCIVSGGSIHRCVLSPQVRINSYSHVEDSILFEHVSVGRHSRIRRAIIDKNVEIPPNTVIGYDLERDRQRFTVTESGIVVIPKGMRIQPE